MDHVYQNPAANSQEICWAMPNNLGLKKKKRAKIQYWFLLLTVGQNSEKETAQLQRSFYYSNR